MTHKCSHQPNSVELAHPLHGGSGRAPAFIWLGGCRARTSSNTSEGEEQQPGPSLSRHVTPRLIYGYVIESAPPSVLDLREITVGDVKADDLWIPYIKLHVLAPISASIH